MGLSVDFGPGRRPWSRQVPGVTPEVRCPVLGRQPADLAASRRGDHLLRAMSRPSSVSPRPPAPGGGCGGGGGGAGPAPCGPGGGARAKGLKDVRIDEEVKIAVNIALERFRYGDQKGEAPATDPAGCPASPHPQPRAEALPPAREGGTTRAALGGPRAGGAEPRGDVRIRRAAGGTCEGSGGKLRLRTGLRRFFFPWERLFGGLGGSVTVFK